MTNQTQKYYAAIAAEYRKNAGELALAVLDRINDDESVFRYPENYQDSRRGIPGFTYCEENGNFYFENHALIDEASMKWEDENGAVIEISGESRHNRPNFWSLWALEHVIDDIMSFTDCDPCSTCPFVDDPDAEAYCNKCEIEGGK